ncbi:hypothetical protein [Endozoicomonas acroporae]|uniref:hypothetical protein n=1 Tax=Endozoicomonas acroporae TaxID=1701104 RepID=UPI0013D6C73F|nr:hypothetical protein [Endozoicomonas acroporae]
MNINQCQEGAGPDVAEQTAMVDRSSISQVPGRSLLASSANQSEGTADDADESTYLLAVPRSQNLTASQQATVYSSMGQTTATGVPASGSPDEEAPQVRHIYHDIVFCFYQNLRKACGLGIELGLRKVGINPDAQPIVAAGRTRCSPGGSHDNAYVNIEIVRPSAKPRKKMSDRLVKAAGLTPEKMLEKPEALNALVENLTEMIQVELKKAGPWPDSVAGGVAGNAVDPGGDEGWVSDVTRSIATILVHLTHEAFLDKVTLADSDAGKKEISDTLTRLIVSILDLTGHPSAQNNATGIDSMLSNGIVTVSQSGNKLFNEKMTAIKADSLKGIINQALVSMMAEGVELTDKNVDELLSRITAIIIDTLMNIRADTVHIFNEWQQRNPDEIDRIQNRIASSAAKTLTTVVQKHSHIVVQKFSSAADGISKMAGKIAGLWKSKSNQPEPEPVKYTEKKIKQLINKQIEEAVRVFQNEQKFKDKLKPLIEENLEKIAPDIKRTIRKLKRETQDCKNNSGDVQDLVTKITTAFADNSQQTEQGEVASAAVKDPHTSSDSATSDQSGRASTSYSAEGMTEPRVGQSRVIDQLIAQQGSRVVDEAIALLTGELRKNLDMVIASVEPGIEKVMEQAVSQGAAFIAERNGTELAADQGLAETLPGFRAAMTPVLTTLAVDILSRKLESEAWEKALRDKGREVIGQSNRPSDSQGDSANTIDAALKTAEAVALQQLTDPLKSVIDTLPLDSLQKLASDVILQSAGDGTVWLDDLVRDLFNRKMGEESIVLAVIDTISEETVKLQHQLISAAMHWIRQRAKEWGAKYQVNQCMDWLATWIAENKEQIDLDAREYVKTLLVQATPELEGAIHERLESLHSALASSRVDAVATFQRIAEELEPGEKSGYLTGKGVKKTTEGHQNQQDHWQDARQAVADQLGNLADETIDLVIKQSDQLEAVKPILEDSIREVMNLVVKEGALFTARHNGEQCDDVNALEGGTVLTEQLPAFLTTATVELMIELLTGRLQSGDWKTATVTEITAGEATADSAKMIAREIDRMLGEGLAGMVNAVADQVESLLQKHPYITAEAVLGELTRQGIHDGAAWVGELVHGLFAGDARVVSRVIDKLTEQAESLVQTLATHGLGWLSTVDQATGQQNLEVVKEILVRRGNTLVEPLLTGVTGEAAMLGNQASESTELRNAVMPFVQDQVQKGQVLERLAAYGVDALVDSVSKHKDSLAEDVKALTRASMDKALPELEQLLHRRLQALSTAMEKGADDKQGVVADLRQAAKAQKPEEKPGSGNKKTTADQQNQQDHWHDARQAVADQLGNLADETIDLVIKQSGQLEAVKPILEDSIREVMNHVVKEGALFAARHNGEQCDDVNALKGGTALTEQLPAFLTTATVELMVELLSDRLQSGDWKTATVTEITAGEETTDSASMIAREVDRMLGEGLAGMVNAVADQVESLLQKHPYITAEAVLGELTRQGIHDGAAWVGELVHGLFDGDARVVSRVVDKLTEQAESLVQTLATQGLGWLTTVDQATGQQNQEVVKEILVRRGNTLVEPLLTGVTGEAATLGNQASESTALRNAVMPFVQDQVQKGHVLERLAAYGVDALVNSVSKHKDDLAGDVKVLTRASMDKALPELEQLLHRRLQALSTAMERGADDKHGVVADLRQAAKAQKPEEKPGSGNKKTIADHQNQQDHWHDARQAVVEQLGNLADETIDLVIKQSGQLEAVKPILAGSIREVMDLVVKEGALFAARQNGEQCDDVNALEGGTALTGQLPAFLTTATAELMVELLSDRLQSGDWKTATVTEITAGEATTDSAKMIAREVDGMLGKGLADMVNAVADQVESLLQKHPYITAEAVLGELTRQGIHDGAAWVGELVHGLFAGDARLVSRVVDKLTEQAESLVQTLATHGLGWLSTVDQATGQQNLEVVKEILVRRGNTLVEPLLTGVTGEAATLGNQASESTALRNAVMPFVQDQVQKGHVLERLAAYGVDMLVNSVSKHKDDLAGDVKVLTRASMDKALPELEQLLHRRLQALSTAMERGADDKHGVVADLRQAAKAQKPEEKPGSGNKKTTADHQNQQDHWHDARQAVADQLGNLADETIDLVIKQSGQLEAVKPILAGSIREVMDLVVKEGALFAARHNGEQCGDVNALEGGTALTAQLPAFLTTATVELMVELLSDRLQSGDWKTAAVTEITAGEETTDSARMIAREIDRMLGEGLAGMVNAVADQVESLLQKHPYTTAEAVLGELTRQGIHDGAAWVGELVNGLFAGDARVVSRVVDKLTEQAESLVHSLATHGLGWLSNVDQATGQQNLEVVKEILVRRGNTLVEPLLTGVTGEAAALGNQASESTALRNAVMPFVQDQVQKGQVLERLAAYGVDALVNSISKHKDDLAGDVKALTRASMDKAVPELEGLLHTRLQALAAAMRKRSENKHDVVADLRQAAKAQKPEERAGDVAVTSVKKTTVDHQHRQDHWHDARQAAAEQASEMVGDLIKLTIDETKQLEVARSILSDSFGKVIKVAVQEGAGFVAKHHAMLSGNHQSNGVVLSGDSIAKLTGVVSPFLTTNVVESITEKLLSAAWQQQTESEVKKAAEQALVPGSPNKVDLPASAQKQQTVRQVASGQRTTIGTEVDDMLKTGLAEMLHSGADQLEAILEGLPYDSVKAMASDLALQGIADGTRWLDILATGLFADNEVVVPRVIDAITEQAVVTQQAAIDGVLGWLAKEDTTTEQQPNRQKLLDILVQRLNGLVVPTVTGTSSLVAESVQQTSQSRALRDAVLPFLQNQLNRGQVLEQLAGYGVDQLSGWIRQHRTVIRHDVEVHVRAMMQQAAPELESILHDRLATLRSAVNSSQQDKGDVVATLRRAAETIAPAQGGNTATEKDGHSRQSQMMDDLIPDLSKGITEVITQGTDIIRRKAWADNLRLKSGNGADRSRMSIFPIVLPHVQRMVKEAVSAGTEYGIGTLAELSDGNAAGITEAVNLHVQSLTANYLGQAVADAIEGMANAVYNNADGIQSTIEKVLKNVGEEPSDLAASLMPHIDGAIDKALNHGQGFIRESMEKWIKANALAATPELHKAIDKMLTHMMANGGEWIIRHQQGVELEVIEPIKKAMAETLKQAQADIIQNIALWLSNDANLHHFVGVFTDQIRTTVTRVVVDAVAKQVAGKGGETECQRAVDDMTPYLTPIIDQVLTRAMTYTGNWFSGWVRDHGADISSLVNPMIDKTVDEVMPSVRQAVQDKALLLARNKAQDIDFNKLAAELATAFAHRFDPGKITSGVLQVQPKSCVARELPKILCFLMQTTETYESLGGNLNEPVKIDRVIIDGRVFKNIQAYLTKMKDGSIQIRKMDLIFENENQVDVDIEVTGVSISYQLPEKSQLYKAALLAAAPAMSPADLARSLLETFTPDHIDFNVDQITGEFHDNILDGPGEDILSFGLSNLKLSLNIHKYAPRPYIDISAGPQDGHPTIESVKVNLAGHGLVDHVEADIHLDRHRNGYADVTTLLKPDRLSRFAGWLIGGPIRVDAKVAINNTTGTLDDIESIRVHAGRFGKVCKAMFKNTLKAYNPGLTLADDGKAVIKLKLTLFSEERSNPITRWLAKTANRILQFFTVPVEIPMSFKGAPYTPALEGERGIGSFNALRFINGLFNPCPLSIHSDTHEELLSALRTVSIDENPKYHLILLGKVIDQVVKEFRLGNAPSHSILARKIPLESLVLLVNRVKGKATGPEDLSRLLFLVANLVEALPERAVQLVNRSGVTPESAGQPYLLHLISTTPTSSWLAKPEDGKVLEPIYQSYQFQRLQEFWQNSQSNPDGSIYSPGTEKQPEQKFTEEVVGTVRQLVGDIDMPDDIRLMMARDFDFANKMFGTGVPVKQDLPVNSRANPLPHSFQGVLPVGRIKEMDRSKRRLNAPAGPKLSEGFPALGG